MSSILGRPKRSPQQQREWFTRLYEHTSSDLLAFLMRRCSTPEDAVDSLAETYRIAWEKRDKIPDGAQTEPWLFGVARNVMRRDHTRYEHQATASRELATALRAAQQTQPASHTPVAAALAELSPLDQEIVTMLAWDGLAPREVAAVLGLSPNVVRVRAHRARQQLRSNVAAPRSASLPNT